MPTPPRTGENEVWYTRRGKRRRPRVISQPGRDAANPPPVRGDAAGVATQGSERKARRTSAHGPREGHGEGQGGNANGVNPLLQDPPF